MVLLEMNSFLKKRCIGNFGKLVNVAHSHRLKMPRKLHKFEAYKIFVCHKLIKLMDESVSKINNLICRLQCANDIVKSFCIV